MSAHRYGVCCQGKLEPGSMSAFEGMTAGPRDGRTDITAAIVGSSYLHRLPVRIAGLGLTVHGLIRLDAEDPQTT